MHSEIDRLPFCNAKVHSEFWESTLRGLEKCTQKLIISPLVTPKCTQNIEKCTQKKKVHSEFEKVHSEEKGALRLKFHSMGKP